MVGAELHFEPVRRALERASHDPRIIDQQVDLVEALQGFLRRRAHAVERCEVAYQRIDGSAGLVGDFVRSGG